MKYCCQVEGAARKSARRPSPELFALETRLWYGVALTAPLWLVTLGPVLFSALSGRDGEWLQLALATPVVGWCGRPFFHKGAQSLRSGHWNVFTLISLSVGAIYLYSLAMVVAGGYLPTQFRDAYGHVPIYLDGLSATIVVLVLIGQVFLLRARARARNFDRKG
jgi:Cu+-exporting ATPase